MTTADISEKRRSRRRPAARDETPAARTSGATDSESGSKPLPTSWHRSTGTLGLAGGLALWAAFPPLGWWPLAWIAPVFWLAIVDAPQFAGQSGLSRLGWLSWRGRLSGAGPYVALWAVSFAHWLVLLQGIRLAHWATYFGWVALAIYLAAYLPLFVGLTRLAVHRFRWPIVFAAPVVWTALELVRGHLLTGFSLALLGHTQVTVHPVIQIADLAGAYGVSFIVMLVAACLWKMVSSGSVRRLWAPLAIATASLTGVLAYGLAQPDDALMPGGKSIKVALIQGSADTIFEYDPQRNLNVFYDYRNLSLAAIRKHPDLDLIVWPESVYTANVRELLVEDGAAPPASLGLDQEQFDRIVEQWRLTFESKNQILAQSINSEAITTEKPDSEKPDSEKPGSETIDNGSSDSGAFDSGASVATGRGGHAALLVGTDVERIQSGRSDVYNTAMFLDPHGKVQGRYYKMHPVMFGEYVPLGHWVPWLYDLTPLSQGLTPGETPQCFDVSGVRMAPSICFESTVPHLVRRQVVDLTARRLSPDVLISVTNDGWFHGSSILDLHLACAVFRAVEHRRPMLVAANTGITAHIDATGRVRQRVAPLQEAFVVCEIGSASRDSLYTRFGDLPALLCLILTVGLIVVAGVRRLTTNSAQSNARDAGIVGTA